MAETRHFTVDTFLDGASSINIEIVPCAGRNDAVVSVRPKGRHIVYTGMLSDVALIVASRHAKALAAANGHNVPKAGRRKL